MVTRTLAGGLRSDLDRVRALHDRAVADYAKCLEFNRLLAELLDRLEEAGHRREADRVMALLIDCSPKAGVHCDKATSVGDRLKKL